MTLLADAARLEAAVARILAAAGCGGEEARTLAGHLVLANLVGHDSHGVIRLREYLPWLERGMVRANRHAEVVSESAVALQIDGGLGFGQVIGLEAMRPGIAKARRSGLAVVGIRNTGHLGRTGHWAEVAAEAGLVSLHFVNTSGFGILTAPFGGREARLLVIVEVLAGALTGGGCCNPANPSAGVPVNSMLSVLIGPDLLSAGDGAADQIEELAVWLKGAAPARPDGEILLPGEAERRTRREREEHGIPLDPTTLGELEGFARAEGAGFRREELAMGKATW